MAASAAVLEFSCYNSCEGTGSCSIIPVSVSAVTKRATGVSSGILVHQDYCAVWLPNAAGHSAKIFPPKSLTHSNDTEMEFQSRSAYPRKTRKNGAPRPMKMGTIVSPWRYDASAYVTMRHVKLRRHTISSCERPQRKRSRMPRPRQVPAIPADKLGIESSFPVAPSSEAR
jgi:hypothetical protein